MTATASSPPLRAAETSLAQAESLVARMLQLPPALDSAAADWHEHLAAAWFRQIDALIELGRPADVVVVADALCAHFQADAAQGVEPAFAASPIPTWIARALYDKAIALSAMDRHDAALQTLQGLQQRFEGAQAPGLREWLARAGLEEARLRAHVGATFARVDMVRHCDGLIQRFGHDERLATRVIVARIRACQAGLLAQLNYDEQALSHYTDLHEDLRDAVEPELQEQAADALHAKARLLEALGRHQPSRDALRVLIERHAAARHPGLRQTLALARMDQIHGLQRDSLQDTADDEADARVFAACDALLVGHADSTDTIELRCVNHALRLQAQLLRERDAGPAQLARAEQLTQQQWTRYAGHTDERIQREVLLAMLDRLDTLDEPARELADCRLLLERFADAPSPLLQPHLARAHRRQAAALHALGRHDEALVALAALSERHAASTDPAVRLQLILGGSERARILRAAGDRTAALAALDALPEPIGAPELPTRLALARAMALRASLWLDQAPAAQPPRNDEDDESGPLAEPAATDAQLRYADAVDALVQRFADDPSVDARVVAANAQYDLAVHWRERGQYQRAVDAYAAYQRAFAADTAAAIESITAGAYLNHAYALMMLLQRDAEALVVYDALIARFAHAASARMRDLLARAAASRLTCLNRLQRKGVAVNYGDQYEDLSLQQRDAISATIERGRVLSVAGQHRDAIACYDQVLDAHLASLHPELRRQCLDAMVRKGYSLGCLAQREAALAVNDEIIARYGDELSTSTEKDVALAMSNRAVQLDKLGRHEEEVQTYDRIIQRWRDSDVAYLRQRVASARYCKAITIADADPDGALALYQRVIDTCLHAPEVAIRLQAAKSAVNRSARLRSAGRYDEAVACGEALLQACGNETDQDIAAQLVKARIGLARAYAKTGQVARQSETLRDLLNLPEAALDENQRSELRTQYRQLQPTAGALGKAAYTLGRWLRKKP
ncbi:MAG: hypothetical protein JF591_08645 [Lysobacter sp.]|nr:hypothetical protein [Lysobacter sp.]